MYELWWMQTTLAVLADELLSYLLKCRITTLTLQHWARLGSQMKAEWDGQWLYFFWKRLTTNSRRIHGVGFAIRTKLLQTLPESPVAISERLMTLRIPLAKHRYATFISTYAPTLPSDDETKEHYYAMLRSTLTQVPRKDKLIVLGDFNARIGFDSTIWGNVMGKHSVGNINSNGHRLLGLCSEFGLFVTNTLFQLKHKHKTTWMHPRSKCWHLLDVLVRAVDIQDVQITRVMRGAECWTDHRLVRTSLRIRIRPPVRKQKPQRRLNVSGLGRRADLPSLRAAISSNLAQVSDCSPLPFQSSLTPQNSGIHWARLSWMLL